MIYVSFTKNELRRFRTLVGKNDVILTYSDMLGGPEADNVIDVADTSIDWAECVTDVRQLFHDFSECTSIDIRGYANNFFECTVKIAVQYAAALKKHSDKHDTAVFANRLIGKGKPNYYLGEHESQGRTLYNRTFTLQNALEKTATLLGLNVNYFGTKVNFQGLNNFARDTAVFSIRFWSAIRSSFRYRKNKYKVIKSDADFYVILRSYSQFLAIKNFLESSSESIIIICGNTFFCVDLEQKLQGWAKSQCHIDIVSLTEINLLSTVREYCRIFYRIFLTRYLHLQMKACNIDVRQAFREILIMSAETNLYKSKLELVLPDSLGNGIFLSCEQKSPQAYIEASVAKKKGYETVQVMACDQAESDLPFPVSADLFITDTLKRKVLFENNWSSDLDKLRYLGLLRASGKQSEGNFAKVNFDVCYFAHVNELEHNIAVINLLRDIKSETKSFRFCIKLHPRDNGNWINKSLVSQEIIFKSSGVNNEQLYQEFDVAISNPSAVIIELLSNCKPFIFIDTIGSYKNIDFVSCDELYAGYLTDIKRIPETLLNVDFLREEVKRLYARVFGENPQQFKQTILRKALNERK